MKVVLYIVLHQFNVKMLSLFNHDDASNLMLEKKINNWFATSVGTHDLSFAKAYIYKKKCIYLYTVAYLSIYACRCISAREMLGIL